ILACCDDDDDYNSAITPVLSTEETENSLSMGDEHLDTIPATKSDKVIKSSVEDLVPIPSESEGIPDTMCDVYLINNPTPPEAKDHFEIVINSKDDVSSSDDDSLYNENIEYVEASPHDSELVSLEAAEIVILEVEEIEDDNLREKLLNVHLLIANIEALKDNPTPSSKILTKSSSTYSKSFLEKTNTFHNSLPEFENFCFNLEEINSGSTTTHYDISLSDYEAFYFDDDYIEEISSGSTTTHSDISLSKYDSFIFDLSNDQFPPSDRSDLTHKEFTDKLANIISPLEYDCFYFSNLPDLGELMSILNSGIRENLSFTTCVNLPIEDDHSPLLAYDVWIFLAYLMYPVIPPYLHSFGNEDTIFDPGIIINRVYSFKPGLSHRCGAFKKFNTHRSQLNEWPTILSWMFVSTHDEEDKDEESFNPIVRTPSQVETLMMKAMMTTIMFAEAISSILSIVDKYLDHRMNEAVKVVVQLQSDRLQDEAQAENEDFLNKLDEKNQKIIKEHVKEQVKVQVSKILTKIEKFVNEQLEAENLTHGEQKVYPHIKCTKNLYKAMVEAYECDKIIMDTYGDTVTMKRRRDDKDKDEKPSAGSNRGSKRRRAGKELESTSAPKEKTSKTSGKSTEGSKSHKKTTSESAPAEEPAHQEFETGATDDQPIAEAS
nr:hypothetical protein [Tanacetum cinerariifolium]